MPFGEKKDEGGRMINFDKIYKEIIHPAIIAAGLDPIRADEETSGGIIHKPMFERLMFCDYAVVDLTTANANVLYELGIRHSIRPHSTVMLFGKGQRLPFDVAPLRGLPYNLDETGVPSSVEIDKQALTERLESCRTPDVDSPLFQLVSEWKPELGHIRPDSFKAMVEHVKLYKDKLAKAREEGVDSISKIEGELNLVDADPAIVVDLFLSYRAVKGWQQMVDLVPKMPKILQRTVSIQEQLALALNRLGQRKEAETVLNNVIDTYGYSAQTKGLLGRVSKDRWIDAKKSGNDLEAKGHLKKAVDSYLEGYNLDTRDPYTGINTLTLMQYDDSYSGTREELLPVVGYAIKSHLEKKSHVYWDFASKLEYDILILKQDEIGLVLSDLLACSKEIWQLETTLLNISLIKDIHQINGHDISWIETAQAELTRQIQQM